MSGEIIHFEIPADNLERAQKFYEKSFGWKMHPMPEHSYTMVQTTDSDERGMPKRAGVVNGGMGKRAGPLAHPTVTIQVEDIEAALRQVEKNGGKTVQKKQPIGDGSMGFTGYFADSEGNTIGLYTPPNGP